jgi:hypothetical protein
VRDNVFTYVLRGVFFERRVGRSNLMEKPRQSSIELNAAVINLRRDVARRKAVTRGLLAAYVLIGLIALLIAFVLFCIWGGLL